MTTGLFRAEKGWTLFRRLSTSGLLLFLLLATGTTAREKPPRYDLASIKKLAAEHNPTLSQAFQQIEGEQGKALQAGLWPNPTIGYVGEQIGLENSAGEFQGGFIRQRIVTGGKLSLSRDKYEARAEVARHNLTAQEFRVMNDVEQSFYGLLAADAKLNLHHTLFNLAKDRYKTVFELVNIGLKSRADLKLAHVDLERARLDLFVAQNDRQQAQASLEAVVGVSLREGYLLDGSLEQGLSDPVLEWESLLGTTLEKSPEVLAAEDKLRADQITLKRERREPIPDLILEAGVGRNVLDSQTVYMAGLSLEIPLFDRNQGTIRQAEADLARQQAEVARVRLQLKRKFASQYSDYLSSYRNAIRFRSQVLPTSEEAYRMELQMYKQSRIDWLDVLETQSTYMMHRLSWIDHLLHFQHGRIALQGFLLQNGLQPPDSPTPPSHIDSVPKPR